LRAQDILDIDRAMQPMTMQPEPDRHGAVSIMPLFAASCGVAGRAWLRLKDRLDGSACGRLGHARYCQIARFGKERAQPDAGR